MQPIHDRSRSVHVSVAGVHRCRRQVRENRHTGEEDTAYEYNQKVSMQMTFVSLKRIYAKQARETGSVV